jgi:hypothetical protein
MTQDLQLDLAMMLGITMRMVYMRKQERMLIIQQGISFLVLLVPQDWLVQTAQTVMHPQQPMLTQLRERMAQQLREQMGKQVVVVV